LITRSPQIRVHTYTKPSSSPGSLPPRILSSGIVLLLVILTLKSSKAGTILGLPV
jgi:hypothetical protein